MPSIDMMNRFGIAEDSIERIIAVFKSHPQVEQAVVYGSRAKGNFKPGSDIDIVLTGDALTLGVLHKIEYEIDDLLLPYQFDLSIYHLIDNPDLLDHIKRIGIVLYSRAHIGSN